MARWHWCCFYHILCNVCMYIVPITLPKYQSMRCVCGGGVVSSMMWWCSIVVPVVVASASPARSSSSGDFGSSSTSHFYAWRSSLTLIGGFFVLSKRHFFVWRGCSPLLLLFILQLFLPCLVSLLPSFISELIVDQKGWRWLAAAPGRKSKEIWKVVHTWVC